ncbi:uncharacterized protein L969DRAFT_17219 [Mixia osmundae IAM 14324]|uniref:Methyltransferase small domain-containing protein n=1 Tax=Mixia osmundae (strain CBS 9802 / IAM 14324 / JCM 22182 / KY 12970) TaxID=764103 RepID=G7E399_MIXOS|nr:uncharacterized protein L969DRAFT_17219 [Mixia osmundae IAM 14324]KEI39296.1 hypothetical protein L969DRAFT_17219 [Mixia osmundae IAM 14324]GAA97309.1 hypothetical protein E5Q_03987 [Mixia osmundae IAM 14324]
MRLKDLESALQPLKVFESPKVMLEQYPTSAHLAARMLYNAHTAHDDIQDRSVLDLGCGCGVLGIGAALLEAAHVIGLDVDDDALRVARDNLEMLELEGQVDLMRARLSDSDDIKTLDLSRLANAFDTVILNPPFGTKTKGIDIVFLSAACKIATRAVHTLHKTSTRDFIAKKAKSLGFDAEVAAVMRYDLPATMKFHKQKSKDIEVDYWVLRRIP